MTILSQNTDKQRIIRQKQVANDFCAESSLEAADILCVFQGLQTKALRKKIRQLPQANYSAFVKTEGVNETPSTPCLTHLILAVYAYLPTLRRTALLYPLHGGEPEPYGRS